MRHSRKASLSLSIEAIVIIVLAMTLLGLGLGFVRSQFRQIQNTGIEVQEQVREQIISQLRTSGEKVSFPRSLTLSRSEQKVVTLGVQNIGTQSVYYTINSSFDPTNSDLGFDAFNIRYPRDCLSLSPAQAEVHGINVRAPSTPGTFALRVNIQQFSDNGCQTPDPIQPNYASKVSFITVG